MPHNYEGLKVRWASWKSLQGKEIGLGWDHEKGTIVASDEWWLKKINSFNIENNDTSILGPAVSAWQKLWYDDSHVSTHPPVSQGVGGGGNGNGKRKLENFSSDPNKNAKTNGPRKMGSAAMIIPNALVKICALLHFDPMHLVFIFACKLVEDPQNRMILFGLPNDDLRVQWQTPLYEKCGKK
ncbi:hypothetical protein Cgig2_022521 [Carnegiea gigantea]|uniref:Uncharacterized protein n=1 Tax=Carnegiea gigantea TaxID=171969 RepID=A0A9Q1JLA4_9CARY|nr:hypothetical protein Cgig2_022521 [Carnegiea gigantea]